MATPFRPRCRLFWWSLPASFTFGCLLSLGLKHRMKKGWQADRAFMSESRDWRN